MKITKRVRMKCVAVRETRFKPMPFEIELRWADARKYAGHDLLRFIIQGNMPPTGFYEVGKTYVFVIKEEKEEKE